MRLRATMLVVILAGFALTGLAAKPIGTVTTAAGKVSGVVVSGTNTTLFKGFLMPKALIFPSELPPAERVASRSPPEGGQRIAPGKRSAARGWVASE